MKINHDKIKIKNQDYRMKQKNVAKRKKKWRKTQERRNRWIVVRYVVMSDCVYVSSKRKRLRGKKLKREQILP